MTVIKTYAGFLVILVFFSNTLIADDEKELAEMQKKLNAEVFEKPFSVEDEKKIDAYIKESMKKELKPEKAVPTFWKAGYTCANIYRYGWRHYRACRYYRRYHGRYWF